MSGVDSSKLYVKAIFFNLKKNRVSNAALDSSIGGSLEDSASKADRLRNLEDHSIVEIIKTGECIQW